MEAEWREKSWKVNQRCQFLMTSLLCLLWLSDCGVPCSAHYGFPYQFSLPCIQRKLFLWQLLSLGQKCRNQTGSSLFMLLNKNSVRWIRPRVLWSVCFVALFVQPKSPLLSSWPLHQQDKGFWKKTNTDKSPVTHFLSVLLMLFNAMIRNDWMISKTLF